MLFMLVLFVVIATADMYQLVLIRFLSTMALEVKLVYKVRLS